jgi:exopolyphosphatase/guanosine-5'-triphosphate,3'-diphosphate pyrophosphatase
MLVGKKTMQGIANSDAPEKAGIRFWATRVLAEVESVSHNFDPDPVHDLRVALRRCRSMADGFLPVDPDPGWKQLKKLGKELFSRLGALRDMQVMEEWVGKLADPSNPADGLVRSDLLHLFASQEEELKNNAHQALRAFDSKHWDALTLRLAERSQKIPLGGLVFQHMAVERWEQAHRLHGRALRNRAQAAYHELRIGIKKFRYTVENFLPERHAQWGSDLKQLQDVLGEVHDLDVLASVLKTRGAISVEHRTEWENRIRQARERRLDKYREKMLGRHSLWHVWRDDLPQNANLQEAALVRLQTWGAFLDPDVKHSQQVTDLALQLYEGLARHKVFRGTARGRRILRAAALLHDVGLAKAKRSHHKNSYRLIRKLVVPLGWTAQDLRAVAVVARYHRGALPHPDQETVRTVPAASREYVVRLAGVLRLANGFDAGHDHQVQRLDVEREGEVVTVRAAGYQAMGATAERVSSARYLLEASCGIAIVIRPA